MNLSKKWLMDYIDLNITDKEFAHGMTMSGSKVEGIEQEGSEIKNIVVGKIVSIEKHTDSDHLWICKVNCGKDDLIQIVTGAQNLKVGNIVPVALNNSIIYGGKEIKCGKLRGVESCGMLCSLAELGLTKHDFPYAQEDGIFILGEDCKKTIGMDIREAIGLNDVITEFEITSNRPDCLSVVGLAREASATFDLPYKVPSPNIKSGIDNVEDLLQVEIEDTDKCYRYVGAVIKNARIKPSPRWIRERLRAAGVRPINNIVDITNFVMLELGQPMHAFDLRYLEGNIVKVRCAAEGEKITTLDGIERSLSSDMLVIADKNKPVAVAGVMGGEYSGIMEDTKTIVFESACFNGISVRQTAKKLGMRTESSARFEKELDPNGCMKSLIRALELVELLDAGDIVNGSVDRYPNVKEQRTLPFMPDWVNSFIGIDVSAKKQKEYLEKLAFEVKDSKVYIPTFRNDIEHQADISEEIARLYGYENIPDRELKGVANGFLTKYQAFTQKVSSTMLSLGLTEVATYSFISPKAYDKIALPKDSEKRNSVVISNPLGEDTSVMRTTTLPSILEVLSRNYNNRNMSVSVFEPATIYVKTSDDSLPDEKQILAVGMYSDSYDFFSLKGIIEELLYVCGISEYDVESVSDNPSYHPGKTAKITIQGKEIAILGEVHPEVRDNFEIGTRTYCAEIDIDLLFKLGNSEKSYKQLPKFPATTRDIAFVCDRNIPVLKLERLIVKAAGNTLEKITLFDVYQGEQIANDKKSVAFSLRLRSKDKTLTDQEADAAVKRSVKALSEIGAVLRQ